ncbi:hypothetical protein CC2G_000119 [Coprinopsis cinerea AmutBmut pab1-1]|nr:hypothetical protein CC2G_000119 [Coprinopsis cinerea AmutBmut pab1-1]
MGTVDLKIKTQRKEEPNSSAESWYKQGVRTEQRSRWKSPKFLGHRSQILKRSSKAYVEIHQPAALASSAQTTFDDTTSEIQVFSRCFMSNDVYVCLSSRGNSKSGVR